MQDTKIFLEGYDGPHNLNAGDFYLDETNECMYIGVGDFSSGGGGIVPVGTIHINANGTYNVVNYANAEVNIPPYGVGEITIDKNGVVNVNGIKTAIVKVPSEIKAFPYKMNIGVIPPDRVYATVSPSIKYRMNITVEKL